jgi:[ribosomal protein S18]-alanine N-acetyltransferase
MVPADLNWLITLAAKVPEAPRWSRQEYERILDPRPEDLVARFSFVAGLGDEPAGFAITSLIRGDQVAELEAIVVDPSRRRQGLGGQLLRSSILAAARGGAQAMHLEVRESNVAAIHLYCRFGFELAGRRESYYSAPAEDALLFKAELPLF